MLCLNGLSHIQRLVVGICILLFVDVIWVASSELTKYLFEVQDYNKPFFTTYVKTVLFSCYLFGFIFWKPWRKQCCRGKNFLFVTWPRQYFDANGDLDIQGASNSLIVGENRISSDISDSEAQISDPIFVPIKYEDKQSGTESDDSSQKSVRFNNLSEVRHLSEKYAEDANLSRLSHAAYLRAEEARQRALCKLSPSQVIKIAFIFSILWFFANFSYQEAFKFTEPGVANVLSSTSGLFTLICAAIYPSCSADKFTLSKLFAVFLSMSGAIIVSIADKSLEKGIPFGALWSLLGAILYALYLVSLRRKVDHEDKLDIPMFFGFVGFFCAVIIWPGFFILHYTEQELFSWPNKTQWLILLINGFVGTLLSEFLWLWGCFLTSSLIATLALSLTIPLTMIADVLINDVSYSLLFYLGSIPVFLSFFAVAVLTHYENWDPVLLAFKKLWHCLCRRKLLPSTRFRELDKEQTESLIGVSNSAHS